MRIDFRGGKYYAAIYTVSCNVTDVMTCHAMSPRVMSRSSLQSFPCWSLNARHPMQARTPRTELSTGQMDPRVGSGHDFAGFRRVGSSQHFGFISFLLIISWYLNRHMNLRILYIRID